jgi:MtrB/PioB family decaheme-associated outer membrane protein
MRNRVIIAAAALLLASATHAQAQQPASQNGVTPQMGSIDFGARLTSTSGDEARYERYRDLRSGVYSHITFEKSSESYRFDAYAENIGYHDQRYVANYRNSKLKGNFMWDSIPLNYSYITVTPYAGPDIAGTTATLTIDPTVRQAVQDKTLIGIPANIGQLGQSIYRSLAHPFDLQQRRDILSLGASYDATKEIGLDFLFSSTKKTGDQPFGASFGFAAGVEVPYPLDQRTNDFSAGVEWANQKGMARFNYDASYFNNNVQTLVWDNPMWGPVDATFSNGYSTGFGASRGRLALPPNNHQNVFSFVGLYKLPYRSTLNGVFTITDQKQNEALIPFTINQAIINDPTDYPLHMDRTTAEAAVRGYNLRLNFTSRPTRLITFTAAYRYNEHNNQTPMFDAVEYVRMDQVWEETGGDTEQFDVRRNTFDANISFNVMPRSTLRVGYGYDGFNRNNIETGEPSRAYSNMADNAVRVSWDTVSSQYITLRGTYEHVVRRGSGFHESVIEDGGAQPGLRYYDESDRDRDRGTILAVITPIDTVSLNISYTGGKDTYTGPGHEFGLLDNSNNTINFGVDFMPRDQVSFGMNYGRDIFKTTQKSRNANPPPDPSFGDPNRDWYLDNDEHVNNFDLYLDLKQLVEKTDVNVTYDYSDSDNSYVHYGPRIDQLAAAGQFIPLPDATNKWQRFTVDVKYFFQPKIGIAVSYWYENFKDTDFATIDSNGPVGYDAATGTPRVDWLGGLILGYAPRPYTGNTGFVRLLYLF